MEGRIGYLMIDEDDFSDIMLSIDTKENGLLT